MNCTKSLIVAPDHEVSPFLQPKVLEESVPHRAPNVAFICVYLFFCLIFVTGPLAYLGPSFESRGDETLRLELV